MLTKSTALPASIFAWAGNRTAARLTPGMHCPHCSRQLSATDIKADSGQVQLICAGCHRDILVIESES